jgi:hypothetical protein
MLILTMETREMETKRELTYYLATNGGLRFILGTEPGGTGRRFFALGGTELPTPPMSWELASLNGYETLEAALKAVR